MVIYYAQSRECMIILGFSLQKILYVLDFYPQFDVMGFSILCHYSVEFGIC